MFQHKSSEMDIAHKYGFSDPSDQYFFHSHLDYEIILFIKGECIFHVEDKKRKLLEGDIVLIKPGENHFAEIQNPDYERFVLKFSPRILSEKFISRIQASLSFFPKNTYFDSLIKQLDGFYSLFDFDDFESLCKCKIWELLLFLIKASQLSTTEVITTSNAQMKRIVNYIKEHLTDELDVSIIAEKLELSESYVRNLFKEQMHVPIMKYIRSKKALIARELILSGKKPQIVSKELKFHDYSTFYRDYLKIIGNPPNADYAKKK